jgi:hypothetical protein
LHVDFLPTSIISAAHSQAVSSFASKTAPSTTMSALKAMNLNNNAITLLEKGSLFDGFQMLSHAKQCLEEEAQCTDKGNAPTACSYRWVDVSSNYLEVSNMKDYRHRLRSNDNCLPFLCQYAVKIHICDTDSDHPDDDEYGGDPYSVSEQNIRWAVLYE